MYGLFPCNIAILFTTFSAKKIFPAVVVFIQTLFRIKSGKFLGTFTPLYILQKSLYLKQKTLLCRPFHCQKTSFTSSLFIISYKNGFCNKNPMIFITDCSFIIPNRIKEICDQPLLQIPTSNNITKIISYFILQKQSATSYFFHTSQMVLFYCQIFLYHNDIF